MLFFNQTLGLIYFRGKYPYSPFILLPCLPNISGIVIIALIVKEIRAGQNIQIIPLKWHVDIRVVFEDQKVVSFCTHMSSHMSQTAADTISMLYNRVLLLQK